MSVTANKFPVIFPRLCHETYSVRQGVEHDYMNILGIGAGVLGAEPAFEVVWSFLGVCYTPTPRHAARLAMIVGIERRVLPGEFSNGEHQG